MLRGALIRLIGTATWLTDEQRAVWNAAEMGRKRQPTPGQTVAQQEHLAIDSYLYWLSLEGIDEPDRAVLERLIAAHR